MMDMQHDTSTCNTLYEYPCVYVVWTDFDTFDTTVY